MNDVNDETGSTRTNQTVEPARPSRRPTAGRRAAVVDTAVSTALAIALALLIGAVLIAVSNPRSLESLGYFFAYPWDFFAFAGDAVAESYKALVVGSLGDWGAITTTLERSAPLICAGLGVTMAFRGGLFNIGAQGQIILGMIGAGYVGLSWNLPVGIHLVVSVLAGVTLAALWGGIAGFLKARTGAHEVITTIMLNWIGISLLAYVLTKRAFQKPGDTLGLPQSPPVADSATFPQVAGVHTGFLVALLAAWITWWILERSTIGFEIRAVGQNPDASRTAGMSVAKASTYAMLLAGAGSGLAAAMLINGQHALMSSTLVGTIGFDAITVALLGRGTPLGTVLAGLLFGALQVGGVAMQSSPAATPPDLAQVLQALIVLFVAAPALVRHLVRMRDARQSSTFAAKGTTA